MHFSIFFGLFYPAYHTRNTNSQCTHTHGSVQVQKCTLAINFMCSFSLPRRIHMVYREALSIDSVIWETFPNVQRVDKNARIEAKINESDIENVCGCKCARGGCECVARLWLTFHSRNSSVNVNRMFALKYNNVIECVCVCACVPFELFVSALSFIHSFTIISNGVLLSNSFLRSFSLRHFSYFFSRVFCSCYSMTMVTTFLSLVVYFG